MFDAQLYGPVLSPLVTAPALDGLVMGSPPDPGHASPLRELTVEAAFAGVTVHQTAAAQACLAAVLLRHGLFAEAHAIAQDLQAPFGSYWHAILHRLEPDYPNARYWFRRVGDYPTDTRLAARAVSAARAAKGLGPALWMAHATRWSAVQFVDTIETARREQLAPDLAVCVAVQQAEWEILFDDCYRRATHGAAS